MTQNDPPRCADHFEVRIGGGMFSEILKNNLRGRFTGQAVYDHWSFFRTSSLNCPVTRAPFPTTPAPHLLQEGSNDTPPPRALPKHLGQQTAGGVGGGVWETGSRGRTLCFPLQLGHNRLLEKKEW